MFASTIEAGLSTGITGPGYALGLKSGSICTAVDSPELESKCDAIAYDSDRTTSWKTNMTIPSQFKLDICTFSRVGSLNVWESAASFPWNPHSFTEDLYIGIKNLSNDSLQLGCAYYGEYDYSCPESGLYVHCQMNTSVCMPLAC